MKSKLVEMARQMQKLRDQLSESERELLAYRGDRDRLQVLERQVTVMGEGANPAEVVANMPNFLCVIKTFKNTNTSLIFSLNDFRII